MAWHLIENTITGELQEIEQFDQATLGPDEVNRGEVPDGVPRSTARWSGSAIVADLTHLRTVALTVMRASRSQLLTASDWTQLPDSPLTEEARAAWVEYRQNLRDLPETVDPLGFEWPTPPSAD